LGGPAAAVDGDFGTGWVADPADPHPTLTLHWVGLRRVSSVRLISDQYLAATRPDAVQVTINGQAVTAAVGADGTARFPEVRTDGLALTFSATRLVPTYDPTTHTPTSLGIGVSEALVPGLVATTRQVSDQVKLALPCGTTPAVTVDGRSLPTHADVTVGQLRDTATFPLSACGADQVDLAAGTHRLVNPSNATFAATRVLLTDTEGARLEPPVATEQVSVKPVSWGATNRAVQVSARAVSTVLLVRENANPGWRATITGKPLRAITIDGWQQGYLMPPGSAATVRLTFRPDRWYRWGLAMGLLLALLLITGAVWPARQPARRLAGAVALSGRAYLPAVGVTALALIGGWWGLAAALLWPAVAFLLSRGKRAGGMWPKRLRAAPAAVSAAAYLISGAAVAWHHWAGPDYFADAALVQIGCLVALATVTAGEDCAGWQTSVSRLRVGGSLRRRRSREPLVAPSSPDASEPLVDTAGP
jgi:arabinofuranan 3-O-arabinosyltransferase